MATPDDRLPGNVLLEWPARIFVLRNRSLWFGFLVGFAVPSILMGLIFALLGTVEDGLLLGSGLLLLFLLISIIIGAVIDLCGGFRAVFRLTEEGVESLAGKATKHTAQLAGLSGLVAGSVGAIGAGLAAREETHVSIPWQEIRSLTVRESDHYIQVRGTRGSKPIGLYCTPQNYHKVLRVLQDRAGKKELLTAR
jgi:hypothetical protein